MKIVALLCDAILPRRGPITRAMARRLQEDWTKDAGKDPRVLMSLRVDFGPMG